MSDAAVVGRPSPLLGEEVAAFIVSAGAADADALAEHCRASLAAYKVPGTFRFVDAFPRNSGGKVLKAGIAKQLDAWPS